MLGALQAHAVKALSQQAVAPAPSRAHLRRAKQQIFYEVRGALKQWRRQKEPWRCCWVLLRWPQALAAVLEAAVHVAWHVVLSILWFPFSCCSLVAAENGGFHWLMTQSNLGVLWWLLAVRICRPWKGRYQFDLPMASPHAPVCDFSSCGCSDACKDVCENKCDQCWSSEGRDRMAIRFVISEYLVYGGLGVCSATCAGPCCDCCHEGGFSCCVSDMEKARRIEEGGSTSSHTRGKHVKMPGRSVRAQAWEAKCAENTTEFYRAAFPSYDVDSYDSYRAKRIPELVAKYQGAPIAHSMGQRDMMVVVEGKPV